MRKILDCLIYKSFNQLDEINNYKIKKIRLLHNAFELNKNLKKADLTGLSGLSKKSDQNEERRSQNKKN